MWQKIKELCIKHWREFLRDLIALLIGAIGAVTLSGCGITRATISRPAEGTQTTVTITTNNPMTTTVNPNTSAETNINK